MSQEDLRNASASLKGFFYQFDKTLIAILENEEDKKITIEKVEDIYTEKETIQVKYHEQQEFSNSIIAKPIALMFKDFLTRKKNNLNYILFVHFKDFKQCPKGKLELTKLNYLLGLTEPKTVLKNDITEEQKKEFLECFKIEQGQSFEAQREQVLKLFEKNFSTTDSKEFFHPKALYIIHELAVKKKESERTITFSTLKEKIEKSKKLLFDHWYIEKKGKEKFIKDLKAYLKNLNVFKFNKQRVIILGKDWIQKETNEFKLFHFIENTSKYISSNWLYDGKKDKRKPLTFVIDCPKEEIKKIKSNLINKQIIFNDGYEHITFSIDVFNKEPFHKLSECKQPQVKDISYQCKVISMETYEDCFKNLSLDILLAFSSESLITELKHCNTTQQIEVSCSELSLSELSSLFQ